MSCLKCKGVVFHSCFKITEHQYEEGEKGYLQLLEIDRSKNETIFVVHEFSDNEQMGFFAEYYSYEEALNLYTMLLNYFSKEEVIRLNEERRRVKKLVPYRNTHRPWFFHPTNKFIIDDIFSLC